MGYFNVVGFSYQEITFAGVALPVAIIEVDGNSLPTPFNANHNFKYNDVVLTRSAALSLVMTAIGERTFAASIRVNLSGQSGLFPTQTITVGNERLIITSDNSNSVVATWLNLQVYIDNTWRNVCWTRDCRGFGPYVYSPIVLCRVYGTNRYIAQTSYDLGFFTNQQYLYTAGVVPYANVTGSFTPSSDGYLLYSQVYEWVGQPAPPIVPPDPYAPGGNTEPGGGDGTGPEGIINDDIDFPSPVGVSASNANFISIWTPTLDQVQNLAAWMWTTDPLKWEFWQKLLQNPLDLIFSLTIMPVPIYHPSEGGSPTEEELVAYTDSLSLGWQNTGIQMDWVAEQYVTIDMGTINLEEVWGAFLDYEPYTKIDIFLPYIGTKQLDTNDCMPRTISLRYIIDLATGTCVALIKCDNSVYYHFSGNCASQIPITVNQCQEIVRGLMTMAVGAATFAIGGPMGAGAHASKAAIAKGAAMRAGGAAMVGSGADSAAKGVNVSRSGVIGAAAGLMDIQTPYLIISRPRQAVPEEQNKYTGYPSFITEQIGDLTGYTEVQMIHLHNMSCTDEEYKEIDSLLTQGVII